MLKTSKLHYRIASYISSSSHVRFTTLSHFYHHLHWLHHSRTTLSILIPRIKPCTHCVTCFLMDINFFITSTTMIIWFLTRIFLERITAVVKFLVNRLTLNIILLSEKVTYVLRRTTPNILALILSVAISY